LIAVSKNTFVHAIGSEKTIKVKRWKGEKERRKNISKGKTIVKREQK